MSEIVKSEYNALDEQGNYKTHFFKTSADQVVGLGRMKNTEYQVGDVVYVDSNLKVALDCIYAGTTSAEELDLSNAKVGDVIEDGTVTWMLFDRRRLEDSVPIGTILTYGANEIPIGYLACDGTAVSRTVYADLFAVIGTTYGAGDGSTTFNLPNLNNNSFLEGSNTAGTVKSAGLPDVKGNFAYVSRFNDNTGVGGAFILASSGEGVGTGTGEVLRTNVMAFSANLSNSIYGSSTTVQPKAITVKFCIKAYGSVANTGSVELEEMAKDYERIASSYLPLSGGELTGDVIFKAGKTAYYEIYTGEKLPLVSLERHASRGFQFYGGLLIQWGSVDLTTSFKTVNFQFPYDSGGYACTVTLVGDTPNNISPMIHPSLDGASVQLKINTGSFGCRWVAIGVGLPVDESR